MFVCEMFFCMLMKVSVVFFVYALYVLMICRLVVFITSAGRRPDISHRIARRHTRLPFAACPFGAYRQRQFPSVDHHPCLVQFQSRFNHQLRHGLCIHEAR